MRAVGQPDRGRAARNLLHGDDMGEIAHVGAAILLRRGHAEQAEIAKTLPEVGREQVGFLDLSGARRHLRLDKGAHGVAQHADVLAQIEVDARDVQGNSSRFLIGPEPTPARAPWRSKRLHFPPSLARIFQRTSDALSGRNRHAPPRHDARRLRPRRGRGLWPLWAGSGRGPRQGTGHSRPRQIDRRAGDSGAVRGAGGPRHARARRRGARLVFAEAALGHLRHAVPCLDHRAHPRGRAEALVPASSPADGRRAVRACGQRRDRDHFHSRAARSRTLARILPRHPAPLCPRLLLLGGQFRDRAARGGISLTPSPVTSRSIRPSSASNSASMQTAPASSSTSIISRCR